MELHMSPIAPLWNDDMVQESSAARNNEAPAIPFADVFQSAIDSVKETDATKNELQYLEATGQLDNPAELTIAENQAILSVQLLVQLRDRALDAYSEVMRISM